MQTQKKELNFEGENIYIGIDIHLKSWNVSIFTDDLHLPYRRYIQRLYNFAPMQRYSNPYSVGFTNSTRNGVSGSL
jgi:hypothetical protein